MTARNRLLPAPSGRDAAGPGPRPALGRLVAMLLLPVLLLAHPAEAAQLRLLDVADAGAAAPPAPGYPVPSDPGMVFYLQRSANPNTVVYAARFEDGALDRDQPLSAFWRRYNAQGQVAELSFLERKLAYGVRTEPRAGGGFDVRFRAVPQLGFVLEERGRDGAVLSFAPEGEPIDLSYGYLELDEGGLAPAVTGLRLFGTRRQDGRPVQVVYGVTGGAIPG